MASRKTRKSDAPRVFDLYAEARRIAAESAAPKSPSSQSGQKATTTKKETS